MPYPRAAVVAALAAFALLTADVETARSAPAAESRWTDVTPDARVDAAVARAIARPEDALPAMAVLAALAEHASSGRVEAALGRLSKEASLPADVRSEARILARSLAADEGTEAGQAADHAAGVVEALSILGPFRDTGGGLETHDGPEGKEPPFSPATRDSWGSVEVGWRPVPPAFAQAGGVALDVFVHPRKESCTWLATRLTFSAARAVVVRAASTGQLRVMFDGTELGRGEDVHEALRFDRVAVRVDADAGDHLLAMKVCSGALDDDGLARVRVTDDAGAWPAGVSESAKLAGLRSGAKVTAKALGTPLGRAVDRPAPDAAARLGAAILRTLGGADDLRSPRAPGLLAGLSEGNPDPDRLAMAAWIAPSGANKSAWLNRARAGGDERTAGFAARRLVERHLEAHLPDWAMATLRGAGLDRATDPEAILLTAQVETALGTDALRVKALRRLQALAGDRRRDTPDTALALAATIAESIAPASALEIRKELAARGYRGAEWVRVLSQTRGKAEVVAAARAAFQGSVDDAEDALSVAEAVAATGAHEEARGLYEVLARWAPNRAGVWSGLAQEFGAAPRGMPRPVRRSLRPCGAPASSHLARRATATSWPCGPTRGRRTPSRTRTRSTSSPPR